MRHGGLSYRDGHPSRNIEKNDESWMTIGPSCLLLDHDEHEHLVVYSTAYLSIQNIETLSHLTNIGIFPWEIGLFELVKSRSKSHAISSIA